MADVQTFEIEEALGELLGRHGKLDPAGLARARRLQRETGRRLSEVLSGLGLVNERDIAAALAEVLAMEIVGPREFPLAPVAEARIAPGFLRARRMLPLSESEEKVTVAVTDPLQPFPVRALEVKLGKPVEVRIGVPSEIEEALERLYGSGRSTIEEIVDSLDDDNDVDAEDADRLRDLASEAPVIRLVSLLISEAVERRASDIHIEPFENRLRVRYRIDGVLQDVASHPSRLRFAVISRVKIMAKLNIAERRLPQDGRIRVSVRGNEIDLRVSTVPTDHGESVVLRILDRSSVVLDFDVLGFAPDHRDALRAMLARPTGIILVTGPTGSGKTTTLYTALKELNAPERKILTVEDPVEYHLEGINQIAARPQIGLGFAEVLRSILRQDPDIVMVGEIRDLETAQIAVQAGLTGHLVLSTLHTNSAAASVTRLLDMGLEGFLLSSTLTGVVAQRLVRRLCPACATAHAAAQSLAERLGLRRLAGDAPIRLRAAVGCERCAGTGYAGRLGITEVLTVDAAMKALIIDGGSESRIREAAIAAGMRTMYDDGMLKALDGLTTVEEVLRVTRDA